MVLAAQLGCAAAPYERAQYRVGAVGGVLYSNSLVVGREVAPRKTATGPRVEYALLLQNEGNEIAKLGLSEVTAELNGQRGRVQARCAQHGFLPSRSLDLRPGQRLRLDCQLSLTPSGAQEARTSDSEIVFGVPILYAGQLVTPEFSYRLTLEDSS